MTGESAEQKKLIEEVDALTVECRDALQDALYQPSSEDERNEMQAQVSLIQIIKDAAIESINQSGQFDKTPFHVFIDMQKEKLAKKPQQELANVLHQSAIIFIEQYDKYGLLKKSIEKYSHQLGPLFMLARDGGDVQPLRDYIQKLDDLEKDLRMISELNVHYGCFGKEKIDLVRFFLENSDTSGFFPESVLKPLQMEKRRYRFELNVRQEREKIKNLIKELQSVDKKAVSKKWDEKIGSLERSANDIFHNFYKQPQENVDACLAGFADLASQVENDLQQVRQQKQAALENEARAVNAGVATTPGWQPQSFFPTSFLEARRTGGSPSDSKTSSEAGRKGQRQGQEMSRQRPKQGGTAR